MKPHKKSENPIYLEYGMECIWVIDTENKEARLNTHIYGERLTLYKVKFDEFYDLEKIKAKLEKKADKYYAFKDA